MEFQIEKDTRTQLRHLSDRFRSRASRHCVCGLSFDRAADDFLRRGSRMPHFGARIWVHVGRPYTLSAERGKRRAGTEEASQQLMGHIAALIDERHRGPYATASVPSQPQDHRTTDG